MLGISKIQSGRMGNRLLHYNFIRQLAYKVDCEVFHPLLPDSIFFKDMDKKPFWTRFLHRSIKMTSNDILTFESDDFIVFVKEEIKKGRYFLFDSPILGELFFDYLFEKPDVFIKIKNCYKNHNLNTLNQVLIGVHFRGTDFYDWNINSILPFSYYKNSIDYCINFFKNENLTFFICTDDANFQPFIQSLEYLKNNSKIKIITGRLDLPPIYDFYNLSLCDVLVSSPSTFAIMAGCLGKIKKIIHNKKWMDYSESKQDLFWIKLRSSQNPFYKIWKEW